MKIIILGNGFDLMHGLKTSVFDFLNYLEQSNKFEFNIWYNFFRVINVNNAYSWNQFEKDIKEVINQLIGGKNLNERGSLLESTKEIFYAHGIKSQSFFKIITLLHKTMYNNIFEEENWEHIVSEIIEDFFLLEKFLLRYLSGVSKKNIEIKQQVAELLEINKRELFLIFNFNYTTTFDKYIEFSKWGKTWLTSFTTSPIDNMKLVNINGDIKNPILGINDLLNGDFNVMSKKYWKFNYLLSDNFESAKKALIEREIYSSKSKFNLVNEIIIMGHDLSKVDFFSLNHIFNLMLDDIESFNLEDFKITIYYKNDADLESKKINIFNFLVKFDEINNSNLIEKIIENNNIYYIKLI